MRPRHDLVGPVLGVALVVVLAMVSAGCGSDPAAGPDPVDAVAESGVTEMPASLDNPLGTGTLGADAYLVRDALVEKLASAGAVRLTLTGGPTETTLDLNRGSRQRFARRFTWSQDGQAMELVELGDGEVCANRAAARTLESLSSNAWGYIEASDRAYSCAPRKDGLAAFVIHGYALRDPVTRLTGLMGDVSLADLGVETDAQGLVTRHLKLRAVEADSTMQQVPTTFDLWVDDGLRLVRAEFSGLDDGAASYAAVFDYEQLGTVTPPAAADRGPFVRHTGSGVPGFGGYLLSQFCPDPTEPCEPDGASS